LRNNYEIDWYVPVELAYNKRFSGGGMKAPKLADKKSKPIKYDFYHAVDFHLMKFYGSMDFHKSLTVE
jgi:hypothetical protein